jgi:CO/xanthine dehydrogenase FAD-binding subunit
MALTEYHRPSDMATARRLLARTRITTVPLAGGTLLVPELEARGVEAVVDLCDLPLHFVEVQRDGLHIGATTSLSALASDLQVMAWAGGLLAHAADVEGPVNLLNAATLGGLVAGGEAGSPLRLALLALDARLVLVAGEGPARQVALRAVVDEPDVHLAGQLILEVIVPAATAAASHGLATVGRTPRDFPIVTGVAVVGGEPRAANLVLGGVTPVPLLLTGLHEFLRDAAGLPAAVDALLATQELLDDFRGSAGYRRVLAGVLAQRAWVEALSGGM